MYDWLLLLHVAAAFALVGALVVTIYLDGYELWDPWIVAAIVLWLVASETGRRAGAEFAKGATLARRLTAEGDEMPNAELRALNQTRLGLALHVVTCAAVLATLFLMIYKPGA